MIGEAKFLRAFFYLNMVDKFGGVPLITEAPNADTQAELPRNSKEEVVDQILKDLDDAAAVLPKSLFRIGLRPCYERCGFGFESTCFIV